MDIALQPQVSVNFGDRIKEMVNRCKITNIEKLLSDTLENMPTESRSLDYIGDLNSNY